LLQVESIALYNLLLEHDLFGKPASTFPDHALKLLPNPTQKHALTFLRYR